MKKTKVETESERYFNDFFDNKNLDGNNDLSLVNNAELSKIEDNESSNTKTNLLIKLLKQVFLFLPGTFLLYVFGFVGAIITMDIFIIQRETLPPDAFFQIILLSIIGLLGSFMTWFGLGDIKNKKHLSIPASIIISSATLAVIFKAIEKFFGISKLLEEAEHFYFYLLPLILIIPILVKSWVDKEVE